jgi:hypothetical protein
MSQPRELREVRFRIAHQHVLDPDADEDGLIKGVPADERWLRTVVDLWMVKEIHEGWDKNRVEIEYHDGETKIIKGNYSEWYESYLDAKEAELQYVRMPALN